MIPVVETFYSFQGEGRFAGTPSIFVRFGGCNLGCVGFGATRISSKDGSLLVGCDSLHAVNAEHFSGNWQKCENLIERIEEYLTGLSFKPDIVFTGGEPLLHHQNPILLEALEYFISRGFLITFETNATIEIDFEKYPHYGDVVFAMSVKLENSGEPRAKRINSKAISAIAAHTSQSFFKFVLSRHGGHLDEIKEITKPYPKTPIYVMPMGSTSKELALNDKYVAGICVQNGYVYSDRLHIRLWDNEEGK